MNDLTTLCERLYDVVEVNNVGAVPVTVAVETLTVINPALPTEAAERIASDADSRAKGLLLREDFVGAVRSCLKSTPPPDAAAILKGITVRMRVAFRRRYLMYDAPANNDNIMPSFLDGNGKALAMLRALFDHESHGAGKVSRAGLQRLLAVILRGFEVDAGNVMKAALGDPDTDAIGFFEFVMVLQPTTGKRCLSDMVALLTHDDSSRDIAFRREVESVKAADRKAESKHNDALDRRPTLNHPVALPPEIDQPKNAQQERLEQQIARLRLENNELQHELSDLPNSRGGDAGGLLQENTELRKTITLLRDELRTARTKITMLEELSPETPVMAASSRRPIVAENDIISRHQTAADVLESCGHLPAQVAAAVTQLNRVIADYQELYRKAQGAVDSAKRSRFDPVAAARSIIPMPESDVVAPTYGAIPVRHSMPMRWRDLDRPPTDDMRHTRTLADPLLTPEERNQLRAKLAAQMRGNARHYRPEQRSVSERSRRSSQPAAAAGLGAIASSHDMLSQLQSAATGFN